MSLLLALDQGTTGSTALVLDNQLRVLGKANVPFRQHFPKPGWVEHEPSDLLGSVLMAAKKALAESGRKVGDIAGVGITNQRETALLWTPEGKALGRAIVWQDRRTSAVCETLKKKPGLSEKVRQKTGLTVDPYFSGTKWGWMLKEGRVKKGQRALAGTVESYLIFQLTGGLTHATDASNASRTLLYNLHTGGWDDSLRELFGVDHRVTLPEIRDNATSFGVIKSGFLKGLPILSAVGDQQAALYGQGAHQPGMAKCTYGTGSFTLLNTGASPPVSQHGLLSTVAWQLGGKRTYALEGSSFISGAAVQWLREQAGLIQDYADTEKLAKSVPDTGGVVFVPALAGLGAPHWNPDARGAFLGLTRGSSRAHLVRAVLESLAYQTVDVLDAMSADSGKKLKALQVDGGVTSNKFLMQFQADMLGAPVRVAAMAETTALGAALLARHTLGLSVAPPAKGAVTYSPQMKKNQRDVLKKQWLAAVRRVL